MSLEPAVKSLLDAVTADWERALSRRDMTAPEFDQQRQELEQAQQRIQQEITAASLRLSQLQNKNAALLQIPTEILVGILAQTIDKQNWTMYQPQNLAMVCKHFSEAVLNSGDFWTTLSLAHHYTVNSTVLRKNQNGPLAVRCTAASHSLTDTLTFLNIAAEHSSRWRALLYSGTYPDAIATLFTEHPAPNVTDLVLCQTNGTPNPLTFDIPEGLPLRYLELSAFSVSWSSPRITGLESLRITNLSWNLPSVAQLSQILRSSPNLTQLILWKVYPSSGDQTPTQKKGDQTPSDAGRAIHLPNLTHLIISEVPASWTQNLLTDIVAPSCQLVSVDRVPPSFLKNPTFQQLVSGPLAASSNITFSCNTPKSSLRIHSDSLPHLCNDWYVETINPGVDIGITLPRATGETLASTGVWSDVNRLLKLNEATGSLAVQLTGEEQSEAFPSLFTHELLLDIPKVKSLDMHYSLEETLPMLSYMTQHLPIEPEQQVMKWCCPNMTSILVDVPNMHARRQAVADAVTELVKRRHAARIDGVPSFGGMIQETQPMQKVTVDQNVLQEFDEHPWYEGVTVSNDL